MFHSRFYKKRSLKVISSIIKPNMVKKKPNTQILISLININTNAWMCPLTQVSNLRIPTLFNIISCCSECMSRQEKKVREIKKKGYKVQFYMNLSISWASLAAQMVKNLPSTWETQVRSLGREYPLEKEWQPTLVFLPGKSQGQGSLAGYSWWGSQRVGYDWATNTFIFHL